MEREKLTQKQERILEYINKFYLENRYTPTVRDICKEFGLKSTSTVAAHLKKLREKGYLTETSINTSRRVFSVGEGDPIVVPQVPILGRVAAGYPRLAYEEIEGYLPYKGADKGEFYALRIRGDSMEGVAILDGDYVVVQKDAEFHNGDIVIALIDDEATCKVFFRTDDKVWLFPRNPKYEPIDGSGCTVLGVVRTVIRNL